MNLTAQVISGVAFIVMLVSFWQKERKNICIWQSLSSFLYAIQYVLLGGYSGMAMSIVGVMRSLLFSKKQEKESNSLSYLFIAIYTIVGIITWDGLISIFPVFAAIIYTVTMWDNNPQKLRYGALIASIFWITYNFSVGAFLACITETILMASNVMAIKKYKQNNK